MSKEQSIEEYHEDSEKPDQEADDGEEEYNFNQDQADADPSSYHTKADKTGDNLVE